MSIFDWFKSNSDKTEETSVKQREVNILESITFKGNIVTLVGSLSGERSFNLEDGFKIEAYYNEHYNLRNLQDPLGNYYRVRGEAFLEKFEKIKKYSQDNVKILTTNQAEKLRNEFKKLEGYESKRLNYYKQREPLTLMYSDIDATACSEFGVISLDFCGNIRSLRHSWGKYFQTLLPPIEHSLEYFLDYGEGLMDMDSKLINLLGE